MKRTRRSGFTLVELLIVIVVIGVLSAMMMLSSTEAVSSAKASNIVSNLRNLKTAALAMYVDNLDAFSNDVAMTDFNGTYRTKLVSYMSSSSAGDIDEHYKLAQGSDKAWYVVYDGLTANDSVNKKLEGRAGSVGLCTGDGLTSISKATSFTAAKTIVGMWVR